LVVPVRVQPRRSGAGVRGAGFGSPFHAAGEWSRGTARPRGARSGTCKRCLTLHALGPDRVVVHFSFREHRPASELLLVTDARDVDLCATDPRLPVDVVVDADLRALTESWMDDKPFVDAIAGPLRS
jgi:hypothetical protein